MRSVRFRNCKNTQFSGTKSTQPESTDASGYAVNNGNGTRSGALPHPDCEGSVLALPINFERLKTEGKPILDRRGSTVVSMAIPVMFGWRGKTK